MSTTLTFHELGHAIAIGDPIKVGKSIAVNCDSRCPHCGTGPLNGTKVVCGPLEEVEPPTVGDITACMNCGAILSFKSAGGKLVLESSNEKEIENFKIQNPEHWQALINLREKFKQRGCESDEKETDDEEFQWNKK